MLCERCKIREANIQYTEVIGGVKTEHNFCAQCARELDFGPYSAIFDSDFPLGKLLSGLLGVVGDEEEKKTPQIVCPTCKTSYEEFIKNSRFGCPDCYGVFDLLIAENIKQLQGSDIHKGKRPANRRKIEAMSFQRKRGASGDVQDSADTAENTAADTAAEAPGTLEAAPDAAEQIRILDARLKEALLREEYETAAKCRDEIRRLREEMKA